MEWFIYIVTTLSDVFFVFQIIFELMYSLNISKIACMHRATDILIISYQNVYIFWPYSRTCVRHNVSNCFRYLTNEFSVVLWKNVEIRMQ